MIHIISVLIIVIVVHTVMISVVSKRQLSGVNPSVPIRQNLSILVCFVVSVKTFNISNCYLSKCLTKRHLILVTVILLKITELPTKKLVGKQYIFGR